METELFIESPDLDGYAIAVRNDWNYKLEWEYISEEEKQKYLESFGYKIITRSKFFDWWFRIHEAGPYAANDSGSNDSNNASGTSQSG